MRTKLRATVQNQNIIPIFGVTAMKFVLVYGFTNIKIELF